MNSEQISKMPIPNYTGDIFDLIKPDVFQGLMLREIAAQLADINDNLRQIADSPSRYALRDQFLERIAVALENKQ